ncbi:MAG: hypothetical protein KGJ07_03690 [Patescibacteria group bacterium]|nr:hypothetical protein [Patescibacteria group bacterium]
MSKIFFYLMFIASINTHKSGSWAACAKDYSVTQDTAWVDITDTVRHTKDTIGSHDSIVMMWQFGKYAPAVLDLFYWNTDTLTDSVRIYENNILLYVFKPALGNAGKGVHDIFFTFTPAKGPGGFDRFMFTSTKKARATNGKTATTNKWHLNYFLQ